MKIPARLKVVLLGTLGVMYITGLVTWVLSHWWLSHSGFGDEPSAFRLWWLQIHSIVSLWFMLLFGYLFNSHIQPAWRRGRKLKSGVPLSALLMALILTVPALFYLTNESTKSAVVSFHTYAGLSLVGFFIMHML